MANLARVRTSWTGAAVIGPAVSTFYFEEAGTGFTNTIGTFFDGIKNLIPTGTVMSTEASGDIIDPATGDTIGVWNDGTPSNITGTGTGSFVYGTGVRVVWETAGLVNSRQVRGSTFIVPFDASNLTGVGSINETARTSINSLATAFVSNTNHVFCVWSRPTPARAGTSHPVVGNSVPDKVSWLRSRRT
jgi:hypothetical protein